MRPLNNRSLIGSLIGMLAWTICLAGCATTKPSAFQLHLAPPAPAPEVPDGPLEPPEIPVNQFLASESPRGIFETPRIPPKPTGTTRGGPAHQASGIRAARSAFPG